MIEQRTDEWFIQRLGCVTASRVADVLSKTKVGESQLRKDYRIQLVIERLTGVVQEGVTSQTMQRGIDLESTARERLAEKLGLQIDETGFMLHPIIPWFGASPDGIILDEHAIVEIKCPTSVNHAHCLMKDKINPRYLAQIQAQLCVTGANHAYFASYDDRFPTSMQLYARKIERDEDKIKEIEIEVMKFLDETEAELEALLEKA